MRFDTKCSRPLPLWCCVLLVIVTCSFLSHVLAQTAEGNDKSASEHNVVTYVLEPFEGSSNPLRDVVLVQGEGTMDDDSNTLSVIAAPEALFGQGALQLDYSFPSATSSSLAVESLLSPVQDDDGTGSTMTTHQRVHNIHGAKVVSFWYSLRHQDDKTKLQIRFSLITSSAACDDGDDDKDCHHPTETWQYSQKISLVNGTEWRQVQIPTSAEEWNLVAEGSDNDALVLNRIRGWKLDVLCDSENEESNPSTESSFAKGVLWMDHLSFEGGPDLLGAFFYADSYEQASRDQTIAKIVHNSTLSESNTHELLNFEQDGNFVIDYWVEQRELWGGYASYEHIPPGVAYYNLSQTNAISLDYTVLSPAFKPGRGHFRLVLFDGSDEELSDMPNGENTEKYYSFHYILEDDNELGGNIAVELKGDGDSKSPFWKTGWSGIEGNRVLDKDRIRGVKFEFSVDRQGEIGSFIEGSIELRNLQARVEYNATEKDTSQCVVEPNLRLSTPDEYFRRVEYLGGRCCETCLANPTCNFALSDGKDCYMAETMEREHVRLVNSDFGKESLTVFWKDTLEARGEVCDVCVCDIKERSINCSGRDLVLPPTTAGTELWAPKIFDMRQNPRLVILGTNAFKGFESIEELLLPANLAYISPDVLTSLTNLRRVAYEETDTDTGSTGVTNAISTDVDSFSSMESFAEVCCSIGASQQLKVGDTDQAWRFCNLEIDEPGIDAQYENFTQYFPTEVLNTIIPTSPLFSEAAESERMCAEYCSILEKCRYFSYDDRLPNAFPICSHFEEVIEKEKVCCHPAKAEKNVAISNALMIVLITCIFFSVGSNSPWHSDHYRDENMTIPGWIAGRVHRTRCEVDNARVHVFADASIQLSEDNGFQAEYSVYLGARPTRGAVWVEPTIRTNDDLEIHTFPSRVVLYDNETVATIKIHGTPKTSWISKAFTVTILNEVTACDAAFSTSNSCVQPNDLAVYVDVVPTTSTSKFMLSAVVGAVIVLALIFVAAYLYSDHKRRHADLLWQISSDKLTFKDPPQILGRGTFGQVLLAEYRGTHVAVKRVIPPRTSFEDSELLSTGSTKDESCDIELGVPQEKTNSKATSMEGCRTSRSMGGLRTEGRRRWNRSVLFSQDECSVLKRQFVEEMRHLSKLRHPCITTVMGAVINRVDEPSLVMEYMAHGSLYDLLHNESVLIDGEQILPILRDMTSGLRFLHAVDPQVIHGDLKAQNILVDSHFRAKVADFGLTQKRRLGAAGTPYWTAPEVLRGDTKNTAESDVYSFGIILYELYSRKNPYDGEQFEDVLKGVCDPSINKRPPIPESCPTEIQSMMVDCLAADPSQRPTFESMDLDLKNLDVSAVQPGETVFSMQPRKQLLQNNSNSNDLLNEVFPEHIAKAMREGRHIEPESKDMVTIFFSDIIGFTSISETLPPMKVANMLDRLYLKIDELSRVHNVLKVETVGDSWMGATNLVCDQTNDHVRRIAEFSLDAIAAANATLIDKDDPSRGYVSIRAGFHSGPIVADVVGSRNPRYCLFGDTVNVSSRMESHSLPDCIQCSAVSARLLQQQQDPLHGFLLIARGRIAIKGKDPMHTFWVKKKNKSDGPPRLPLREGPSVPRRSSPSTSIGKTTTVAGTVKDF